MIAALLVAIIGGHLLAYWQGVRVGRELERRRQVRPEP
jgi:membrane protein DedA with SNARE-associated domain